MTFKRLPKKVKDYDTAVKYFDRDHKEIGSGCYGVVFCRCPKQSKIVVKVGSDHASRDFLHWVYKNKMWKKNPAFPKVTAFKRIGQKGAYVAKVEKLEEIGTDWAGYKPSDFELHGMPEVIDKKYFKKALRALSKKNETEWGHSYDLHSSNIMKRKNGQVVLTDPLS